ncbi:hypothetical protein Trydic_g20612 [Trypoxylus dichotomus]
MAQFVTHIQPTLMEASQHHSPMHHHKETHHPKEHHHTDAGRHKEHKELEGYYKDVQMHQGHPREFPVLPSQHALHMHDHHHHHYYDGKSYYGHDFKERFQEKDSHAFHRDCQGHSIDEGYDKGREHRISKTKPVPPKHIDLNPVYTENKQVSLDVRCY